jgi:hypothetical protein
MRAADHPAVRIGAAAMIAAIVPGELIASVANAALTDC